MGCSDASFLSCAWGKCTNVTEAGVPVLPFETAASELQCVCDEGFMHDTLFLQQYNCSLPTVALHMYLGAMEVVQSVLLVAGVVQRYRSSNAVKHIISLSIALNALLFVLHVGWAFTGGAWHFSLIPPAIGCIGLATMQLTAQLEMFLNVGSRRRPSARRARRLTHFKTLAPALVCAICFSLNWLLFWGKNRGVFNGFMLLGIQATPFCIFLQMAFTTSREAARVQREMHPNDSAGAVPVSKDLIALNQRVTRFRTVFTRALYLACFMITVSTISTFAAGMTMPFHWLMVFIYYVFVVLGLALAPLFLVKQQKPRHGGHVRDGRKSAKSTAVAPTEASSAKPAQGQLQAQAQSQSQSQFLPDDDAASNAEESPPILV